MKCSCCGGEKVVMLAPSSVTMRLRHRKPSAIGAIVLVCLNCDRVNRWPTADRFKGAW